jgi:hypothetical protein
MYALLVALKGNNEATKSQSLARQSTDLNQKILLWRRIQSSKQGQLVSSHQQATCPLLFNSTLLSEASHHRGACFFLNYANELSSP